MTDIVSTLLVLAAARRRATLLNCATVFAGRRESITRGAASQHSGALVANWDPMRGESPEGHFDVTRELGTIAAPVLVIAGRHDYICGLHWAEMLARGIPSAIAVTFERSGNMALSKSRKRLPTRSLTSSAGRPGAPARTTNSANWSRRAASEPARRYCPCVGCP